MCGEKGVRMRKVLRLPGSPPHVRGKVLIQRWGYIPARITPACAGKSKAIRSVDQIVEDHPRMCGEKIRELKYKYLHLGSPPHVRGKVAHDEIVIASVGITPACAGKRPGSR